MRQAARKKLQTDEFCRLPCDPLDKFVMPRFNRVMEITSDTIQVIGYGSLLLEASAQKSAPDLQDFRLVRVPNYIRIFNKVGIVFHTRRLIEEGDVRRASCATRFRDGAEITCSTFRCSASEFENLFEREHRFKWIEVEFLEEDGTVGKGRMCTEWSDKEYRDARIKDDKEYHDRVGQYYEGKIWRNDILPFPEYLELCLNAAASHGTWLRDHFIESSYLADAKTTVREYLEKAPNALAA